MKKLLLLPLLLTGCQADFDVNPVFEDFGLTVNQEEVFSCTIDAIKRDCVFGVGQLTCNAADGFLYEFDTGAGILNQDNTQATCDTVIRPRFNVVDTDIPLFKL